MKILITGFGYAGASLSYFLSQKGFEVTVFDTFNEKSNTSTRVSAGVLLPITGKRKVLSFNVQNVLPFALSYYQELQDKSALTLLHTLDICYINNSYKDVNDWYGRSSNPEYSNYIRDFHKDIHKTIKSLYGGFIISNSGFVDSLNVLRACQKLLINSVYFESRILDYEKIIICNDHIEYEGRYFDKLIICDGFSHFKNPFFDKISFKPVKGEIVDFVSNELSQKYIINGNIINYLNKNGKEFIDRLDVREKNDISKFKIREFFP
jgi:hypothetical protein